MIFFFIFFFCVVVVIVVWQTQDRFSAIVCLALHKGRVFNNYLNGGAAGMTDHARFSGAFPFLNPSMRNEKEKAL